MTRVTIADVARLAGVSTATVSRVLAGKGRAGPATRERITAAAAALGYRPSGIAQSLRQGATNTLGLIVTDIGNPFFPQLVRSVEDAARAAGYVILLCNADDDPGREAAYLDVLLDRRVDGVIIASSNLLARHRDWLATASVPVVLVNTTDTTLGRATIGSDGRAGGRIAARHLVELGHRSVGLLAPPPQHADGPARIEGAMVELRGAAAVPFVVTCPDAGVAGGERGAADLLARSPGLTGLIAYNDLMALGAIRAVRATGRRVPAEVSVIGFDDIELAGYVDPPLTTIAQATSTMGRWAVECLAQDLARRRTADSRPASSAGDPPFPHVVLPVRLVARASTGAAPS